MNDDLHDEVEEMFRDETRKHRQEARKTPNIPPGYYDDKLDPGTHYYNHGLHEELELRRRKHLRRRKKL